MRILTILLTLFFAACSSKNATYLVPSAPTKAISITSTQIGVKKVEVPDYLLGDKIMVKDGIKLTPLDANFASSIDGLLTDNAIKSLKTSLADPNVFLYPWDVKSKKGVIIKIVIDDYLFYEGAVHLKGSYFVSSAKGALLKSKNFVVEANAQKDANSIVMALGKVFDSLMQEIAQVIPR